MFGNEFDGEKEWQASIARSLEAVSEGPLRALIERRKRLREGSRNVSGVLRRLQVLQNAAIALTPVSGGSTTGWPIVDDLVCAVGESHRSLACCGCLPPRGDERAVFSVDATVADILPAGTGLVDVTAHAALWRLGAIGMIAFLGQGTLTGSTFEQLEAATAMWIDMEATQRSKHVAQGRRALATWPFVHAAVERWSAHLRGEYLRADRELQADFEAGTARNEMRRVRGDTRPRKRAKRKGTLDERALRQLMTHVGEQREVPTKVQIAASINEEGRRQDLSDPTKCPQLVEVWQALDAEFGTNKQIGPRRVRQVLDRLAENKFGVDKDVAPQLNEDRTKDLADTDGRARLSRVARNTSAQRESRRDDEAES